MPMTRLEELRRRVELDPASPAFATLAEEYRKAGQFDEAIATARTGLERFPSYLSARVTLGRALIEIDELEEARTHLEEVISQSPDNLAAIRALVDVHHRLVDPTLDTEVDALAAALGDRVGDSSTDDGSPPPTLVETPHRGTSAATDGDVASLEALLAPLTESANEPASSALDGAFGKATDDVERLERLFGAVSEASVEAKGPDVASTEPVNIEPVGFLDLSSSLVGGAETPPPEADGDGEFPPVGVSDPLDEDPRVAVGLQRFLDAIVERRSARRKRTAE